jgi:hypothetical protein
MNASNHRTLSAFSVGAGILVAAWSTTALAAAAATDDIRDIRPLILIPPWWHWAAIGLVGGLVVAAMAVAYRLWRRRSARPLTPEEQARQELIKAESFARQGRCREWADLVAPALRTALAARLHQDVCPQTTAELATAPWMLPPNDKQVDGPRLLDLLSTCDLTRFAMGRLDADSLLASTEAARDWVTRLFAAPEPASTPLGQVTP